MKAKYVVLTFKSISQPDSVNAAYLPWEVRPIFQSQGDAFSASGLATGLNHVAANQPALGVQKKHTNMKYPRKWHCVD